jgi:hypothetical protein
MNIRNENEIKERRLAHQIRTALDASANRLPPDIADRLAAARRIALGHKKAEVPVTAHQFALPGGHGDPFAEPASPSQRVGEWLRRFGVVAALVVLGAGLAGIYQWQQQKRIDELVDVDAAMLLDDLPPAAYADQGFHVFLKRGQ